MIHYNLWFDLKDDADEPASLGVIQAFLDELFATGAIAGFQLLKNSAEGSKTKLLRYQTLIEFNDDAQFSAAFAAQAARGIHTGLHGQVMSMVSDFRIEIFRQIAASSNHSPMPGDHP